MKNKIIMIILLVSIFLVLFVAIVGLKIGKLEIPSISKIIDRNESINSKINQVSELTSVTYPAKISNLEATIDSLNIEKEKYEQVSGFDSDDDLKIYETEKYDIGYLWTKLGQMASKNKIKISIDVKQSSQTDLYDLYFSIQGEYVHISNFITKLENDSDLLFRIYNFKLVPGGSDIDLNATFIVKDVNIDNETLMKGTNNTQTMTDTNNATEDNQVTNTENTVQ